MLDSILTGFLGAVLVTVLLMLLVVRFAEIMKKGDD